MEPLYLVAVIKPKTEEADTVREFLDSMIAATRDEDGCEMYDLVVGDDDPNTWLMIEKWSSRTHWLYGQRVGKHIELGWPETSRWHARQNHP